MISPTSWTLYATNEEAWSAMLADCAQAKKSIALEQFIFTNDEYGKKLIDICAERAATGVTVRFLWDAAGSFSFFGSDIAKDLKKRGIELVFWKTLIPGYFKVPNFRSWYLRNHRRTLVIDEHIGYTGSICVSDRMKGWRDTNARFEGAVVREMSNAFDRMWARATEHTPLPPRVRIRDHEFRYVTNYPAPKRRHVYAELIEALRSARKYVYITTPYFVPTRRLARVIKLAAHRGVDVKIILPERTDHYPTLDLAARSYFKTLLHSGARIFLYEGNVIHSKAVVIDGEWATVGSMNLDSASLLYNFEANIITTNVKFVEELSAHFVRDMHGSREVRKDEWDKKFFTDKILFFAIRFIRKFL
ncbi:MAG: phospholipase D-like domain-containing protein [Patescibacteria group bacterium]